MSQAGNASHLSERSSVHQRWEYFPQYIRDGLLAAGMDQPLVLCFCVDFFVVGGGGGSASVFARSLKINFQLMVTLNLLFQSGGLFFKRGRVEKNEFGWYLICFQQ